MANAKNSAQPPVDPTAAQTGAAAGTETKAKRTAIKSFDLTDLRIITLNGEGFTSGRHNVKLGLLQKRQHAAAYPVVSLLKSLGITDPEAIVGQVKADSFGRVSRLYGIEIVRSKDGTQVLFRAGDHQVPLTQQGDKLVAEQVGGGISFELKSKVNSTDKYLIAKATLTTKINPANYAVQIALDQDLKDEDGSPIDAASLLQADFNGSDYSTLLELMAPPKAPPIMMFELAIGAYPILAVAEPVVKKGKRKDGQDYELNSYAITIEVDGEPAVTYSSDDVMKQLDGIRAGLTLAGIEFDPSDVLDLQNSPKWLHVKDVHVKNPEQVDAGTEEPKYRIIATITDQYPMKFNAQDTGE